MQALLDFVRRVDSDPELQRLLASASSPEVIIGVAAENGYSFAVQDLRQMSRDLSAPYWPWAAKGHAFRRAWFQGA